MNSPTYHLHRSCNRSAVTVLEVLFATLIIVVGLIGIASILPVAARNAQVASSHTNALNLGLGWADSFFARGLYQPNGTANGLDFYWVWKRDLGDQSLQGWVPCLSSQLANAPGNARLGSSSYPGSWARMSICIDPNLPSTGVSTGPYRATVFPYFDDYFDPVTYEAGSLLQPRMLRVSLSNSRTAGDDPVDANVLNGIFRSVDDLTNDDFVDASLDAPTRNSLPSRRLFARSPDGRNMKASMDGQYTWMATVTPASGSVGLVDSALVTFVVLNRHDHRLPVPTDRPTGNGERLVKVTPLSGNFVGGAGGRVALSANAEISDQMQVGDWMLLGQMISNNEPYFRWYRIIGMMTDPAISGTEWSREVVLEGPDFKLLDPMGIPFNTIGVLVGGVVTVVERYADLR